MERANIAAALHKGNDRALILRATGTAWIVGAALALRRDAGMLCFAEVGFVRLDDFAAATERAKAASRALLRGYDGT